MGKVENFVDNVENFVGKAENFVGKVENLVGKVGAQEPGMIGPGFRIDNLGLGFKMYSLGRDFRNDVGPNWAGGCFSIVA